MSVNASTDAEHDGKPDHRHAVNGIMAGYSGFVPRARDKYAGASTGLNENNYSKSEGLGPQRGCVREEDVLPERFLHYMSHSNGCVPGYTGFRPGARDVANVTAYGRVPKDMADGIKEREFHWERGPTEPPVSFRDTVGGVMPGYAGFVPNATEKHGTSHYGKLHPNMKEPVPLAQAGHADQYVTKECAVNISSMPGYQGHIPQARDAYGTTVHGRKGKKKI